MTRVAWKFTLLGMLWMLVVVLLVSVFSAPPDGGVDGRSILALIAAVVAIFVAAVRND